MRHARAMHAQTVADAFGLGRAASLSDPVARGELGEIRRLETDHGTFAVKQRFETWPASEAETSTAYHRVCWEAGIATPEPLRAMTGGFTAQVDGDQVRAYTWAELADPDPTLDPAAVGTLVARLHQVRHPWPTSNVDPWFEAPIGRAEWSALLEASRAAGAPHGDRLAELLPGLLTIEELLTPMRPVQTCHLDLWADNLRRSDGRPFAIDFDNAGPGDPSREIAMVILEFGRGDAMRQRTLYDAYLAENGPISGSPWPSCTTSATATSRRGSPAATRKQGHGRSPGSTSSSTSRSCSRTSTLSSRRSPDLWPRGSSRPCRGPSGPRP
jgi:Ser/Thr protein kinase RdoA (MazF antagonist)